MEGRDAIAGPGRTTSGVRFSDVRWVAETASTNADVIELARQGEGEGVVVVADHQTAGRGRSGRTWSAPAGSSLLCTVLLRPPSAVAPLVTFALAVAAAEAVEQLAGFAPGLKWPNDLVVEGDDGTTRKLAGILAEAEWPVGADAAGGHRRAAVHERATVAAGIGLNVEWPLSLPDELASVATAINHVTGSAVDRGELLGAVLDRFAEWYGSLVEGRRDDVLDAWRERSSTLGRPVRVDLGSDEVVGTAVDVTPDGHLVIGGDHGSRRVVAVGDVVHLRPGS